MSLYNKYRPRRSFGHTLLRWVLIVVGIAIFAIGWQVTEINFKDLVTGFNDVQPLLNSLLHPEFVTKETKDFTSTSLIQIPCTDNPPPQTPPNPAGYMIISETCAARGETIGVQGLNYPPRTQVTLSLAAVDNPRRDRLAVVLTDVNGEFTTDLTIPADFTYKSEGLAHRLQAEYEIEFGPMQISETTKVVFVKMIQTVLLALMATIFAIVFAIPFSFLGARNLMTRTRVGTVIYYIVRFIMNLTRAIEPLIWAIIFAVWVGIGPFAGVLALTVHSIAALGKLYSEQIEGIENGPLEAITATGASGGQRIIYGVVPQIVAPFIAFTLYRWDINGRMSTVIGLVGGGGIGFLLIQWINLLQYEKAAVAVWAIAIVVSIMDYSSAVIRERLV